MGKEAIAKLNLSPTTKQLQPLVMVKLALFP
jgi:hypothetical protein